MAVETGRGGWCLCPDGFRFASWFASCSHPRPFFVRMSRRLFAHPGARPGACVLFASRVSRTRPVRVPCTRPGVRFDQRGTRNRRDGHIQSELIHIPLLHGTSTTRPCPWPTPNTPLYYCPWRGATLD